MLHVEASSRKRELSQEMDLCSMMCVSPNAKVHGVLTMVLPISLERSSIYNNRHIYFPLCDRATIFNNNPQQPSRVPMHYNMRMLYYLYGGSCTYTYTYKPQLGIRQLLSGLLALLCLAIINPRCTCAARVTVLSLCVCVSVCVSVSTYSRSTGIEPAHQRYQWL